jgi:hypothetical protein
MQKKINQWNVFQLYSDKVNSNDEEEEEEEEKKLIYGSAWQ